MRRARRGQGAVELALGSLVFVTVILFGIHFAEVGIIKLRTQQAGASALWDTTGRRMHELTASTAAQRFPGVARLTGAADPANRAEDHYRDFERLSTGAPRMQLALTRGSRLAVTCRRAEVATMPLGTRVDAGFDYPPGNRDGIECNAEARVNLFGAPARFLDQGDGFFQEPHFTRPQLQVCAFGRARGGSCRGMVPIALDDWGLSGSGAQFGDEANECDHKCLESGTRNVAYRDTVKRVYDSYLGERVLGGFQIDDFVRTLFTQMPSMPSLKDVPVNETDLRFAFIGEGGMPPQKQKPGGYTKKEFGFATREQDRDTVGVVNDSWPSTPYSERYRKAYAERETCFLGQPCSRTAFDKQSW